MSAEPENKKPPESEATPVLEQASAPVQQPVIVTEPHLVVAPVPNLDVAPAQPPESTSAPKSENANKSNVVERLSSSAGQFFSSLPYILIALTIYCLLAMLTFLLLCSVPNLDYHTAAFIAYEMATGGDPYNFREMASHPFIWHWLLFLHAIAWVIVPVLIGTAADAAFRVYERRRSEAEKLLERIIKKQARKHQLPEEAIDDLIAETREGFSRQRVGLKQVRK